MQVTQQRENLHQLHFCRMLLRRGNELDITDLVAEQSCGEAGGASFQHVSLDFVKPCFIPIIKSKA